MGEIIFYRKEYLPRVIRLFHPEVEQVDGWIPHYQQLFSLYQPDPEQSCLLLRGADKLLACAYFVSLEKLQPNLLYAYIQADRALPRGEWNVFWQRCLELAQSLVPGAPVLRTAAKENSNIQATWGFRVVREQVEMRAALGNLPPVQERAENFSVVSLADAPHYQQSWMEIFNQGLSVFYNLPPFDLPCLERLQSAPGYDGAAFRLGLVEEEALAALFYWVLDADLGLVRINAPASSSGGRGRGFGRRMLKETLNHLEHRGFTQAVLYADAASQATSLLYKMLGFTPQGKIKIMEYQVSPARVEVAATKEAGARRDEAREPVREPAGNEADHSEEQGFFPAAHSFYERRKKTDKPE